MKRDVFEYGSSCGEFTDVPVKEMVDKGEISI